MGKRGRPPHPDILTPREWEVLALIRDGLTNEEIAGRLGISVDGVKFHVSQILSKLGVSSREEAARWRVGERPWWQAAGAPFAWLWRRSSSLAPRLNPLSAALAAGVLAAALGGLMAFGLLVLYTSHRSENARVEQPGVIPAPVNGWAGMMFSDFVDGSHGWVPLGTRLFQTIDGGQTWTREYEATDDIAGVSFLSPQTGWLRIGHDLWMSEDGGQTWKDTGPQPPAPQGLIFSGMMNDMMNRWASSGSTISLSSDGGISWQDAGEPCSQIPGAKTRTGSGAPQVKVALGPFSISFINSETGWAVCSASYPSNVSKGELFRTTDAGKDWKLVGNLPTTRATLYMSLQFIDENHGWLLDDTGLHATSDGGRSWHTVALFVKSPGFFSGMQFVSERQGFLDYNGGSSGPSAIFGTQDGGVTWTQLYAGPPPTYAPDVRFCQPSDLEASMLTGTTLGAGYSEAGIGFRNRSSTPCKLNGVPAIDLLDDNGNVVPITFRSPCSNVPSLLCGNRLEDVVLAVGTSQPQSHARLPTGQAYLSFSWPVYLVAEGPPPCNPPAPLVTSIVIHLPAADGDVEVSATSGKIGGGILVCKQMDVGWFQSTSYHG